jgi:VIT1/CCC1 family predicted Fe2+/Mn2+ transporter
MVQPFHPQHRRRLVRSFAIAGLLVGTATAIGVAGYHYLNREAWIDALVDATMILGGMGPVSPLATVPAKLFASFYALFSGLVFIGSAAVLVGPWAHLLLHRFHAEVSGDKG